jgi:DNA-binding NtrC family response regulator
MGTFATESRNDSLLTGTSLPMLRLREMIRKVGSSRVSVLLQGESGTGKELVARAIYAASPQGEFVPIDCGSLAPTLIESELFGHQRGAFTGAVGSRTGLLQTAHGGTAFFDEIGELPAEVQVKLLRVLQQKEIRAVGSNRSQPCSFRVIAATNRNLEEEVRCGRFRLDLYFRLNVVALELPPLRHRKEDIPCLIADFLQKNGYRNEITLAVLEAMMAYSWPGNIRELHNCIDRLVALSSDQYLHMQDLQFHRVLADSRSGSRIDPEPWISTLDPDGPAPASHEEPRGSEVLAGSMESAELAAVQRALSSTDGNMTDAAQLLGIGRTTLYRKLKRYDLGLGPAWREGILVHRKLRPVNTADILNERRLSVLALAGCKVEAVAEMSITPAEPIASTAFCTRFYDDLLNLRGFCADAGQLRIDAEAHFEDSGTTVHLYLPMGTTVLALE